MPNQKQGLQYILRHVIICTAEKCDEAVEITKCSTFNYLDKTNIHIQEGN